MSLCVMMKPASGSCNMNCRYCFYCDETAHREQENFGMMSETTLKNVIRRTMLQARFQVTYAFQGGEPTLRGLDFFKRVAELERQYNRNHIRVNNCLQTNGLLLDEAWCGFLAKEHFLVGLSLDGTAHTHDSIRVSGTGERAKGTCDRVMRAAELMDRYGVAYNILTVVTDHVAEHIEEIYREYRERGFEFQQYIPCMDPLDVMKPDAERSEATAQAQDHSDEPSAVRLTPEPYGAFLIRLFDLYEADVKAGRQVSIRTFENYLMILAGQMPEACDHRGTCGVQYLVEADGSVYPCDFYAIDEWRLGNFNEDRLPAIDTVREAKHFAEASRKITDECRSCRWHHVCRGGCQRNRIFDAQGDGYQNRLCAGLKHFFEARYDRLAEMARERMKR